MSVVCAFDNTVHENIDALHAHLRRFRVSRQKYYHQYFPRRDPISGELIPFRDLDQYMSQDFASKTTLKKWLKQNPEEGWQWSKQYLANRKRDKNLIYAPSQAELRTLCCPSIPYFESVGAAEGGYYGVTQALGFKNRYTIKEPTFTPLPPSAIIARDTREKNPLVFPEGQRVIVDTLNVGDYALSPVNTGGVHIERKSLGDFCGTLSTRKIEQKGGEDSSYERFKRELQRAHELGVYIVMMVENNINDAQRFDHLPQTRWVQASPSFIFHNMRELLNEFPLTWQVLFVDGRKEMSRVAVRVFELKEQVRNTDLQYLYEEGKL